MKTLYIDCSMGVAGDMLTAALFELIDDRDSYIRQINSLGLRGVEVSAERYIQSSIVGTRMHVNIGGHEETEAMDGCRHEHFSMDYLTALISSLSNVSDSVKHNVLSIYKLIAEAESEVHGGSNSTVHLHEVGSMDAIADITGVCLLLERLSPDIIYASPVNLGSGQIRCAHGIMPVPAPATAQLLKGIPAYGSDVPTELCTPTGAAILRHFVSHFCSMPEMKTDAVGYGFGKKEFPKRLNAVRVFQGSIIRREAQIIELVCNIDDMTPEDIAFAAEQLLINGALDAWTTNIGMKKGRPGVMLSCLCDESDESIFIDCIFKYTSTLGIRKYIPQRYTMDRHTRLKNTENGRIRIKHGTYGNIEKSKPEYEDIAEIARITGKSPSQVREELSYNREIL